MAALVSRKRRQSPRAGSAWAQREVERALADRCWLCAREVGAAPVMRSGRPYCSIECARSVPARYHG